MLGLDVANGKSELDGESHVRREHCPSRQARLWLLVESKLETDVVAWRLEKGNAREMQGTLSKPSEDVMVPFSDHRVFWRYLEFRRFSIPQQFRG